MTKALSDVFNSCKQTRAVFVALMRWTITNSQQRKLRKLFLLKRSLIAYNLSAMSLQKVENALKNSKCIFAQWVPWYFFSRWEWSGIDKSCCAYHRYRWLKTYQTAVHTSPSCFCGQKKESNWQTCEAGSDSPFLFTIDLAAVFREKKGWTTGNSTRSQNLMNLLSQKTTSV